ncbi:MAG TPA: hypothetical protein VLT47_12065 [Anaeromyxobacteraceae bacterium]|nr:hypothetical protein [Anaeromyxobacteraceae bacterium]
MNRLAAAAVALATVAACGGGSSKSTPPPPPPPPPEPVVVTRFEAASTLIGQPSWSTVPSATTNACAAGSLFQPYGAAAWDGTHLIVPDSGSGRLLLFDPMPPAAAVMPSATRQIGEPTLGTDLTTCGDALSTLFVPQAPTVFGGRLVVADSGFHQVFVYPGVPTDPLSTTGRVEVGSPLTPGCSAIELNDPRGALLAGVVLVVADTGNNRVLFFEPDAHDLSKYVLTIVLGQVDATVCLDNRGGTAPAADTLLQPKAVWTDGTRLIVADSGNNRLLVWNTFPTASGQAADAVLGQGTGADRFTTAAHGAAADQLWDPESIASDGTQLFVADTGNNRVLVYPTIPATSGAAATIVLGQADFGCSFPNDDGNGTTCNGVAGTAPTQRTLDAPTGVSVVGGLLSVTDTGNGRLLVYRPTAP